MPEDVRDLSDGQARQYPVHKPSYTITSKGRVIQVDPHGNKLYHKQQYQITGDKIVPVDALRLSAVQQAGIGDQEPIGALSAANDARIAGT